MSRIPSELAPGQNREPQMADIRKMLQSMIDIPRVVGESRRHPSATCEAGIEMLRIPFESAPGQEREPQLADIMTTLQSMSRSWRTTAAKALAPAPNSASPEEHKLLEEWIARLESIGDGISNPGIRSVISEMSARVQALEKAISGVPYVRNPRVARSENSTSRDPVKTRQERGGFYRTRPGPVPCSASRKRPREESGEGERHWPDRDHSWLRVTHRCVTQPFEDAIDRIKSVPRLIVRKREFGSVKEPISVVGSLARNVEFWASLNAPEWI